MRRERLAVMVSGSYCWSLSPHLLFAFGKPALGTGAAGGCEASPLLTGGVRPRAGDASAGRQRSRRSRSRSAGSQARERAPLVHAADDDPVDDRGLRRRGGQRAVEREHCASTLERRRAHVGLAELVR